MKYIHLVLFFIMVVFAALQWNDPDRGYWIAIYLAASILALIALAQLCSVCIIAWSILLIIICTLMLVTLLPVVITFIQNESLNQFFAAMQDDKPQIEKIREFSGLLIIIVYSIVTAVINYQDQPV